MRKRGVGDAARLRRMLARAGDGRLGALSKLRRKLGSSARLAWLPVRWRAALIGLSVETMAGRLPPTTEGTVVIVSHELAAAGAPKVLVEIVEACVRRRWAVIVVGPDAGPYVEILAAAGAVVIVSAHALAETSPAVHLARHADAVLCNTVACAAVVRSLDRAKAIWYLHETGSIDHFRRWHPDLDDLIGAVADVWAASPTVAAKIAPWRPDPYVIGASCRPVPHQRAATVDGVVTAVVLGSIEPRKGQDLLVDAVRLLPATDRKAISIVFYGRIIDAAFGQRFSAIMQDVSNVTYGGSLEPAQAIEALTGSSMLVVCSRDEPLPLVAIEAMSAGIIVVCSRAAGISAYLEDGISGYVAPSPEPADLAATLSRTLADRDRWEMVGEAGRQVYEHHFAPAVFERRAMQRIGALMNVADGEPTTILARGSR